MTSNRWEEIVEIFNAVAEQSADLHASLVKAACHGDDELRREVESLLDAYRTDPEFLEQPAGVVVGLAADLVDDSMIEEHVGSYRIVTRVGSGGMGTVYLAERDDEQFRQRVALKVVKRGMDSEEILRRFRSERQIVAVLDHPNIARLLDGGLTNDGRPYFVMEYIEGAVPIDRYCDEHRLRITERLQLFRTIAETVHYAHQNLVVHRDLKPGNILVSETGGVKLLDFGIAKPLDPDRLGVSVAMTRTELRLLTPEYASPEQVRGEAITTASDVYALGVLLYELLTGHRPYRLKSRATGDIERVICLEEPERPSTVVRRPEEAYGDGGIPEVLTPEAVAAARGTRVERLRRELGGDLDNIVLKAMHKEPQRRYASAEALSDDVRRYLDGEPVTARKDSFGYRSGKFVGRHKIGVAAASTLFTAVSGFGVVMSVQARRIARERDKARRAVQFLKDLFRTSDPFVARGDELTAREILDRGAERIVTEMADEPDLQWELLMEIAVIYMNLDMVDRAEALNRQCLDLVLANYPRESREVALVTIALAGALRLQGKYDDAIILLRQVVAIHRRIYHGDNEDFALAMNDLAIMLVRKGEYAEAEELFRESLAMRRRLFGDEHREVARSLNNLAFVVREYHGNYIEAEQLLRSMLPILERLSGEIHPDMAKGLGALASVLVELEQYEEAEALDRRSLKITRQLFTEHTDLANKLGGVAAHPLRRGELDEAEAMYTEASEMWRRMFGENHPDRATSLMGLGEVAQRRGDCERSEQLYRQAIAIGQESQGKRHPVVARRLMRLASLMGARGRVAEAEDCYREALSILLDGFASGHPQIATCQLELGSLLVAESRFDEALPMLSAAAETLRSKGRERAAEAGELLIQCRRALCEPEDPSIKHADAPWPAPAMSS